MASTRKAKSKAGSEHKQVSDNIEPQVVDQKTCGLVMPISSIDGCTETHWEEVREIITEALEELPLTPQLVSDADEVGIIHQRIVKNIYSSDIVICDVSAKNPNVMFELGMRLAFDKPTVIIKDDKTDYSFDTAPVEHLTYPRDLRFAKIVSFKEELKRKVNATLAKFESGDQSASFLSNFGSFKVPEIREEEIPGQEYIIQQLSSLSRSVDRMGFDMRRFERDIGDYGGRPARRNQTVEICFEEFDMQKEDQKRMIDMLRNLNGIYEIDVEDLGDHLHANIRTNRPRGIIKNRIMHLKDTL